MTSTRIRSAGVDTVEYGAISGELEVVTEISEGLALVKVSYAESFDIYTVKGSGIETSLSEEEASTRVIEWLTRSIPLGSTGNAPVVSVENLTLD